MKENEKIEEYANHEIIELTLLPNELLQYQILTYLMDADLVNIGATSNERISQISKQCLEGVQILVVAGDYCNSEVFDIYPNSVKENHKDLSKYPDFSNVSMYGGMLGTKIIVGSNTELYEYNLKEDTWVHIQRKGGLNLSGHESKGCFIQDTYLVCGGKLESRVELLNFYSNNSSPIMAANKILTQGIFCSTKLPFQFLRDHTISNVGNNKVILAGGNSGSTTMNSVYQIQLKENKNDISWKELKQMRNGRDSHVAFKMENDLYVAGGYSGNYFRRSGNHSCERYDIEKNGWFTSKHSLPYELDHAHSAVSADESFAVITGGRRAYFSNRNIIIYTEQNGFQYFSNVSLKYLRRDPTLFSLK